MSRFRGPGGSEIFGLRGYGISGVWGFRDLGVHDLLDVQDSLVQGSRV